MPQIITIPFSNQRIGQGFNSTTRESIGFALSVASISEDKAADGQTSTGSFKIVTDQTSLLDALNIQGSADARIALFSTNAKMAFSEKNAVNSFSTCVAGIMQVNNSQRAGSGFALTQDASAVLGSADKDAFKTAFGDMFVRALNTGGEFLVIAHVTSTNEDHQRSLGGALQAELNGVVDSGSFKIAFDKAQTDTSSHTTVEAFSSQVGGLGSQQAFVGGDAAKITARLIDFPQAVHDHPVGYESELASYDTIPIPVTTAEESENSTIAFNDCRDQKFSFLRSLASIELALGPEGPLLFDDLPSPEQLTIIQNAYRKTLSNLMDFATAVSKGKIVGTELFVPNPPPPPINFKKKSVPLPKLSLRTLIGHWNCGDDAFGIQTLSFEGINDGARDVLVTFRHDGPVHQFFVTPGGVLNRTNVKLDSASNIVKSDPFHTFPETGGNVVINTLEIHLSDPVNSSVSLVAIVNQQFVSPSAPAATVSALFAKKM